MCCFYITTIRKFYYFITLYYVMLMLELVSHVIYCSRIYCPTDYFFVYFVGSVPFRWRNIIAKVLFRLLFYYFNTSLLFNNLIYQNCSLVFVEGIWEVALVILTLISLHLSSTLLVCSFLSLFIFLLFLFLGLC